MDHTKYVTWRHLQPGTQIRGYKCGNLTSHCRATVQSANYDTVYLLKWGTEPFTLDSQTTQFEVEMTEKEIIEKYRAAAQKLLQALNNVMLEGQCGYHEMWNSWLSVDPYEMAAQCMKNKITVVGYMKLSQPKFSWKDNEPYDIGICCEYEDGERFWCHAWSGLLKTLNENFESREKQNLMI